ncbi:DNA mismatch repair protein MutS [Pontibacter sp. JH31]|uniref:DNA mismatch repair protein MutS n=1 Tax=Pontibacter aquaedesilientis TaxID=2766980 RepID=A0ABR7XJ17_9BACT|nr:DNA mismatch repair protein MutS [Pontibacter aquaedesilientis]MBD1398262.1 DNA mismatch repair protein MutS [Pontibacter aquaedesilientis]
MHNREEEFKQRAADYAEQEKQAAGKSRTVSWLRVVVFVAGAGVAWYFFNASNISGGIVSIFGFYILFLLVMRWHSRLDYRYKQLQLLGKLNLQEIERLHGRLDQFDGGVMFKDDHHAYTSDLDIFGSNSLFQLINRSVTSIGKLRLAQWLQQAAPSTEVLQRQDAVAELTQPKQQEWLQQALVKPMHYKHAESHSQEFFNWLRQQAFYKQNPFLKVLVFLLPVLTLAAIAAWLYGYSGYIPVAFLAVQYLLGLKFQKVRDEYYDKSIGMYEAMQSYTDQLRHMEQYTFTAPLLAEIRDRLYKGNTSASEAIGKVANIIDYFSWRLSTLMSFFLNTILMWDFVWIYRLESWKAQHLDQVEKALDLLAEFEALASMAAFQYAHPHFAIPKLSAMPFVFDAEQLAHPLIFTVDRIANDFQMQGAGKTIVVTGSNMSGKTTFLRTVGINMVLAFMGAPVCAQRMTVAPMQVYTAMRTVDNLAENTSSFYAELKRLRILLNMTEGEEPVFYLLDEILKGTNSRDRHAGAMALIRQLHRRNASGLISTHDLELGAMEQELPGSVENYSFNSTIEGDRILFDYTLQRGICRSFNASKLMQLMGIEMERTDATG